MTDPEKKSETTVTARSIVDDPVVDKPARELHPLLNHASGLALFWSAAIVVSITIVPAILDRIHQTAFSDGAIIARTIAPTWPTDGAPTMWPNWLAVLATGLGLVVVVLGIVKVKLPREVILVVSAVLALCLLVTAWKTFDLIDGKHWVSIPAEVLCVIAFLLSARAAARWKLERNGSKGSPITQFLIVLVLSGAVLVAGAAIIVDQQQQHGVVSTLIGY
ncbi:hypothetical protein [Jatrophihabitans fulvus]